MRSQWEQRRVRPAKQRRIEDYRIVASWFVAGRAHRFTAAAISSTREGDTKLTNELRRG